MANKTFALRPAQSTYLLLGMSNFSSLDSWVVDAKRKNWYHFLLLIADDDNDIVLVRRYLHEIVEILHIALVRRYLHKIVEILQRLHVDIFRCVLHDVAARWRVRVCVLHGPVIGQFETRGNVG